MFTGIPFIILGVWFAIYPPKKINPFVGYRTRSSMRNQDTWDEANRYSNKLLIVTGTALIIIGGIFYFVPLPPVAGAIAALALTIVAAATVIALTERRLNKLFDREGNRRVRETV